MANKTIKKRKGINRKLEAFSLQPEQKKRKLNSKKHSTVDDGNYDDGIDDILYCICRKSYAKDDSEMVQCSECMEWFHLKCIKSKKKRFAVSNNHKKKPVVYSDEFECPICVGSNHAQNEPNNNKAHQHTEHNGNKQNRKSKKRKRKESSESDRMDIDDVINAEDKTCEELVDSIHNYNHDISSSLDEILKGEDNSTEQSEDESVIIKLRETLNQKRLTIQQMEHKIDEYELGIDEIQRENKILKTHQENAIKQRNDYGNKLAELRNDHSNKNDNFVKLMQEKDAIIEQLRENEQKHAERIKELQNALDIVLKDVKEQENEENNHKDNHNILQQNKSTDNTHSPTDWWQCSNCGFENQQEFDVCQVCTNNHETQ